MKPLGPDRDVVNIESNDARVALSDAQQTMPIANSELDQLLQHMQARSEGDHDDDELEISIDDVESARTSTENG